MSTRHSLSLYDIRGAPSTAANMSHVETAGEVNGYTLEKLGNSLQGIKVIVIPASIPWKPGMTWDHFFNTNAPII
jgi:malate dehydrogenase